MIQDLTSPIGELSGKSVKTKNEASKIKTVQQLAKFAVDHKHCIRKDGLPPGVDIHTVSRVADYITEAKHDGNVIAHGGRPIDRSRGVESFVAAAADDENIPANSLHHLKGKERIVMAAIDNKKKKDVIVCGRAWDFAFGVRHAVPLWHARKCHGSNIGGLAVRSLLDGWRCNCGPCLQTQRKVKWDWMDCI
jgi:hypothetical protein